MGVVGVVGCLWRRDLSGVLNEGWEHILRISGEDVRKKALQVQRP